jgi:hypothetical protein
LLVPGSDVLEEQLQVGSGLFARISALGDVITIDIEHLKDVGATHIPELARAIETTEMNRFDQ